MEVDYTILAIYSSSLCYICIVFVDLDLYIFSEFKSRESGATNILIYYEL